MPAHESRARKDAHPISGIRGGQYRNGEKGCQTAGKGRWKEILGRGGTTRPTGAKRAVWVRFAPAAKVVAQCGFLWRGVGGSLAKQMGYGPRECRIAFFPRFLVR